MTTRQHRTKTSVPQNIMLVLCARGIPTNDYNKWGMAAGLTNGNLGNILRGVGRPGNRIHDSTVRKLCDYASKTGPTVTVEWLAYNEGPPPADVQRFLMMNPSFDVSKQALPTVTSIEQPSTHSARAVRGRRNTSAETPVAAQSEKNAHKQYPRRPSQPPSAVVQIDPCADGLYQATARISFPPGPLPNLMTDALPLLMEFLREHGFTQQVTVQSTLSNTG